MRRAAIVVAFVGSPTAAANGDVTVMVLPGGLQVSFTGHDVRWPDGRQPQRVGLVPDVPVSPTIAGIRAGRDEVLDKAVAFLKVSGRSSSPRLTPTRHVGRGDADGSRAAPAHIGDALERRRVSRSACPCVCLPRPSWSGT